MPSSDLSVELTFEGEFFHSYPGNLPVADTKVWELGNVEEFQVRADHFQDPDGHSEHTRKAVFGIRIDEPYGHNCALW